MVGKRSHVNSMSPPPQNIDPGGIADRMGSQSGIAALREALAGERAFLVGGAVRDLLLGASHPDLDVAVEGDAPEAARRLGANPVAHERFATATVELDGVRVDLASTRTERYPQPGALPDVEPASLERDLARRDFTVNAMAIPLAGDPELIDPHEGLEDLRAGHAQRAASGVVRRRPDPRPPRRALRGPPRLRNRAGDLRAADGDRSRHRLERAHRGGAPADRRRGHGAGGVRASRPMGPCGHRPRRRARLAALQAILARPEWADLVDARRRGLRIGDARPGAGSGCAPALLRQPRAALGGHGTRARAPPGRTCCRAGRRRRLARRLRPRLAPRGARDRRRGPDGGGRLRGAGGRPRPRRRPGRQARRRDLDRDDELRVALAAAAAS